MDLDGKRKLFYSGADRSMSALAGAGILTSLRLSDKIGLHFFGIMGLHTI